MGDEDRILAGRYRLIEPLGEGGMGTVWKAEHIELDTLVAVKLIDEDLAESPSVLKRFKREAKAAAALSSAHVVRTFDYGVENGVPFIVMELLEGDSLDERLARVGRLSIAETAKILSHVARALDLAHARGIVHRDIKPGNIFLTRNEDGGDLAKVLDFGVAKSLALDASSCAQTRTGTLVGSPSYMSPEQMHASKDLAHTTDIWSLGVVAYECVVGDRAFAGETLPQLTVAICLNPVPIPSEHGEVPPGFDEWFAQACDRDPGARFQSAKEFAEALMTVAEDAKLSGAAVGTAEFGRVSPAATTPSSESAVLSQSTDALVRSHDQLPQPRPETAGAEAKRKAVGLVLAVGVVAVVAGVWLLGRSTASPNASAEAMSASAAPAPSVSEPEVTPALAATVAPEVPAEPSTRASASAPPKSAPPKSTVATRTVPAAKRPLPAAPRPAPPKATTRPKTRDYGF